MHNIQTMHYNRCELACDELGDVRVVGVERLRSAYVEKDVGDAIDRLHIAGEVLGSFERHLEPLVYSNSGDSPRPVELIYERDGAQEKREILKKSQSIHG